MSGKGSSFPESETYLLFTDANDTIRCQQFITN